MGRAEQGLSVKLCGPIVALLIHGLTKVRPASKTAEIAHFLLLRCGTAARVAWTRQLYRLVVQVRIVIATETLSPDVGVV